MLLLYKILNWMFMLSSFFITITVADNSSPLNGQSLRVLPMDLKGYLTTKRNATNHILEMEGINPEMLNWFSLKYKFSFELLDDIAPLQDDSPTRRGAISYAVNGEADFLLGTLAPTAERYKKIDYTTFFILAPSGLLIPFPETLNFNIAAVIQPFSIKVWVCFLAFLMIVSISLYAIHRCQFQMKGSIGETSLTTIKSNVVYFERVIHYVLEVAVSRGARCFNTSFKIRLMSAVWGLACFILAQAYNVELISYIMAPNRKPIINSPYDIPKVPGLKLTVDRGYPIDVALMATNTSGLFKDLANTLRAEPELRCNVTSDCLKKVRDGRHVYAHGIPILNKIIDEDWKETGTCHYLIAKEPFDRVLPAALGFPKGSHYTDSISKGILKLRESGLLNHWMDKSITDRDRCLNIFKDKTPASPRLTLQNMSSPFILLVIGYTMALVAFVGEKLANFLFNKKPTAKLVVQPVAVAHLEAIIIQDLEEAENISEEKKKTTVQVLDEKKDTVIEKMIAEIKQSEPVAKPVVQSVVATPLQLLIREDLAENLSEEKIETKQVSEVNKNETIEQFEEI